MEQGPNRKRRRGLRTGTRVISGLALLWYLAFIARTGFPVGGTTFFTLFDDAMIAMRYARNFADGLGLVWNPGEYIEGYTNFLWTVWMSLFHFAGIPDSKTSLFVALSGAVILLANIRVIRSIAAEFTGNRSVIFAAMALAAFSYALVYWTLRGMEVGIITLGLNVSVLLALRTVTVSSRPRLLVLTLVLGLMLLTRTDCLLMFVVVAAWTTWRLAPRKRLFAVVLFAATLLLFLGGHTLFRLLYYHDPLPNTFYLKVGGTPAMERILRGLRVFLGWLTSFFIPVLLVTLPGLFASRNRLRDPRLLLLAAPFLVMSAYSVYVGGDAWEWMPYANRYITIALPLALLFAVLMLEQALQERRTARLLLALTGSFCIAWYLYMTFLLPPPGHALSGFYPTVVHLWHDIRIPMGILAGLLAVIALLLYLRTGKQPHRGRPEKGILLYAVIVMMLSMEGLAYIHWLRYNALHVIDDRKMVLTGLKVRSLTTPDTKIAVVWGGAIPYFAHRYTVDLMGKMDRTIAKGPARTREFFPGHTKWNYGYSVYRYRPDIVLQLFTKTPYDDSCIMRQGYDHIKEDLFIRKESRSKLLLQHAVSNRDRLYELMIRR